MGRIGDSTTDSLGCSQVTGCADTHLEDALSSCGKMLRVEV